METSTNRVEVCHATPLCRKCDDELSKVERASGKAGTGLQVTLSPWKRLKYGLRFLSMPVVVVDDRPFSVLGAFGEETLIVELRERKTSPDPGR